MKPPIIPRPDSNTIVSEYNESVNGNVNVIGSSIELNIGAKGNVNTHDPFEHFNYSHREKKIKDKRQTSKKDLI